MGGGGNSTELLGIGSEHGIDDEGSGHLTTRSADMIGPSGADTLRKRGSTRSKFRGVFYPYGYTSVGEY